jgi:hypothetical protein
MDIICQDGTRIKFEDFQNLMWDRDLFEIYMDDPTGKQAILGTYKDNKTVKWIIADINNNRLRGTEEYKMPTENANVENFRYKNLKEIINLCKEEIESGDINTHATLDLVDLIELRLLLRGEK